MIDPATLPENPGCYLYADTDGTIIYVGKAKNLKKRVSSYFTKKDHDPKTRSLVEHIASVDSYSVAEYIVKAVNAFAQSENYPPPMRPWCEGRYKCQR